MNILAKAFLTWFCLYPLLASWELLATLGDELHQEWHWDYRQAACGRYEALVMNLRAGKAYVMARYPDQSWIPAWEEAESQVLARWDEALEPLDCSQAEGYRLYQQENPNLPPDYPNWWLRWILPEGPGDFS